MPNTLSLKRTAWCQLYHLSVKKLMKIQWKAMHIPEIKTADNNSLNPAPGSNDHQTKLITLNNNHTNR